MSRLKILRQVEPMSAVKHLEPEGSARLQVVDEVLLQWRPPGAAAIAPTGSSTFRSAEARGIRSVPSITTIAEYVLATEVHVQRVGLLAQELLRRHRTEFAAVDEGVLAEFAALHDAAKTNTGPEFLARHRLERPLAEDLVRTWGTLLKPLPNSVHPLIETVNRVDAALEREFFERKGLAVAVANQYRLIVEVADKVDRGMAPLSRYEEMGKTAVPVSEYLKRSTNPRDADLMRLARGLETDYHLLIPTEMNFWDARGPR